jgi:hypothetical protein
MRKLRGGQREEGMEKDQPSEDWWEKLVESGKLGIEFGGI